MKQVIKLCPAETLEDWDKKLLWMSSKKQAEGLNKAAPACKTYWELHSLFYETGLTVPNYGTGSFSKSSD